MILKAFAAAMLAATLLLALSACGKTQSPAASDNLDSSATQQTEQQNDAKPSADEDPSNHGDEASQDEAWKEELAETLFENYGVLPEYYEDLGDGIYQVYVEVGGEVVPFGTVDSATGEYHG